MMTIDELRTNLVDRMTSEAPGCFGLIVADKDGAALIKCFKGENQQWLEKLMRLKFQSSLIQNRNFCSKIVDERSYAPNLHLTEFGKLTLVFKNFELNSIAGTNGNSSVNLTLVGSLEEGAVLAQLIQFAEDLEPTVRSMAEVCFESD